MQNLTGAWGPREQRAKNPAAVHRENRHEIEAAHEQVPMDDELHEAGGVRREVVIAQWPAARHADNQAQRGGDGEVHRRAGERDEELAGGLARDRVELRHAADGHQQNPPHAHAEVNRGERVPEFMQDDAGEEHEERRDVPEDAHPCAIAPAVLGYEGEQQEEGEVDRELDAADAEKVQRPAEHASNKSAPPQ